MKIWKYLFLILVLAISVLAFAVTRPSKNVYQIIACDVGQGDAVLITRGEDQILIDGGPDKSVTDCLSRHLPFWDREVEMIILTHPQKDHYQGLIEIFKTYQIKTMVTSGLDSSNEGFRVLKNLVGGSGAEIIYAKRGTKMRLGLIYLEVVNPSETRINLETQALEDKESKVLGIFTSKDDPNDFSVVVNINIGNFAGLFTGDVGPDVIDDIISSGMIHEVEYLKVPHHGSKNGLSQKLLEVANPDVAVISVGKNQWGHPHKEVLDMLGNFGIRIFRTDENGDIVFETDGNDYRFVPNNF